MTGCDGRIIATFSEHPGYEIWCRQNKKGKAMRDK